MDIDVLREKIRDYYGLAIGVIDNFGPIADMLSVDSLSDEEILELAEKIGIK